MEQVRKHFEDNFRLTDRDWEIFSSKLVRQEFPKKTVLLETGEIENYLSFITKGTIRFYIPKEDNDFTFSFAFENNFVSAYDSFLTRSPSIYQVQALTDTVVWRVSYDDLQGIYKQTIIGNEIGRQASESLFLIKTKRELSLLTKSAEDRYMSLFSEQPHLIREIPLKYIASYIGVTPQALSRIRKRIY